MFNVRLAGGHLYGKQLFTWLLLVVSLMASFVLSFFPLDVLDEIWDLIESVSEGFLTYSCKLKPMFVDLLCTWLAIEHHKPMIVVFKHKLEVQTQVCNSETYVCRLIVHLACHTVHYSFRHFSNCNIIL